MATVEGIKNVRVFGRCDANSPHSDHIFATGTIDYNGDMVMQSCPGQYAMCSNCDDRKCMACVFREWHDDCENSCPMCC